MATEWVTIFTTSAFDCKWCIRLKELLSVYNIDFYEKDIHENAEWKEEFQTAGHRTVPQVYVEGVLIGGYETSKLYFRKRFFENYPHAKQAKILEQLNEIE